MKIMQIFVYGKSGKNRSKKMTQVDGEGGTVPWKGWNSSNIWEQL
jgi:hypothetical protein